MVHDLEQHDFVLLIADPLQGAFQGFEIGEKIAGDDDDLAAPHPADPFGQTFGHPRFFDRADRVQTFA